MGLKLTTTTLRVSCSTDWASREPGWLSPFIKHLTPSQLRSWSQGLKFMSRVGFHAGHGGYLKKKKLGKWVNKNKMQINMKKTISSPTHVGLWITIDVTMLFARRLCLVVFCFVLFLCQLYTQRGAWTHNPEIKSHLLHWLSRPGLPKGFFKIKE